MSLFYEDLARDLQNPEFRRAYVTEVLRVEIMRQADSPFVTGAVINLGHAIGVEQPDGQWFNIDLEALASAVTTALNPRQEAA